MLPSPSDLSALSSLLDEALDLDPAQTENWLNTLPEAQWHLRPRLRSMLSLHESDSGADFLSDLPKLDDPAAANDDMAARPGDLVGPYRLIREIGRGGMGAVWLAERADGSFKRQVALKLPRLAWGANLAERMARERDIGALLEHPHIARLYDAGLDALGRPYLAMEYIDGQPLDVWCASQSLTIRERLRLFLQVTRAVAYAHGRLVVHRDLKPSNILVSSDAQVHLLDFGIAKLLDEAAPYDNRLTQEGRVLTPHYASPEQVRGENITVASDVYSLGILLYELLTGQFPHAPRRKSVAALEEAILDTEPDAASSRVQSHDTAKTLRGDIDAILAKAIKREPQQRYATADAFADDIERYLNGDTVQAQPDSLRYRISKTLLRNRLVFTAAAAVLVAVIGGTAVSIVQAKRANDAAERARVVKEFVVDIFKVNTPENAGNAELRKLPAELLLEHGAGLIEAKFAGQTQLQAELYGVVAGIFIDIGATQQAIEYATKHVASLADMKASQPEQANAILLLAQALHDQKRYRESETQARRAMSVSVNDERIALRARLLLAQNLWSSGQIVEAERVLAGIEDTLRRQTPGPSIVHANAMHLRAQQIAATHRFDEAMLVMNAAIDEALAAEGALSRTAIDIRLSLATSLILRKQPDLARAPREAALAALRSTGGASEIRAALEESQLTRQMFYCEQIDFEQAKKAIEHNRSFITARGTRLPPSVGAKIDLELAMTHHIWGSVERSEQLVSTAVPVLRMNTESPVERRTFASDQGKVAVDAGHHEQADTLLHERLEMRKLMGQGQMSSAIWDYVWVALNLGMQSRHKEAFAFLETMPAFVTEGGLPASGTRFEYATRGPRARLILDSGDPVAALKLLADTKDPDEANKTWLASKQLIRGEALCESNKRAEGLSLLQTLIASSAGKVYQYDPLMNRTRAMAGLCALANGQRQLALQYATQAREAFIVQPGVSPYYKIPSARLDKLLGANLARR